MTYIRLLSSIYYTIITAVFLCLLHTEAWSQTYGILPDDNISRSGLTHYLGLRASGAYVFSSVRD
ncbi:MAG: hypothetical protein K2H75_06725, partial [Muribaculaceae bacterium]|nr:hypothetical protein [Muribaculaceae bacterium]